MKVLFDQGTPVPLRRHLHEHDVSTAFELGWHTFTDTELLNAAEEADFAVLVTTDQNLRYQQRLKNRSLAVVVLSSTSWPKLQHNIAAIRDAISAWEPGSCTEVIIRDIL